MKAELLQKLSNINESAKAGKVQRFLLNPSKYLLGAFVNKFSYRIKKDASRKSTNTFFNSTMTLDLPAGMDIYLLGAKSHDSEIRLAKYLINVLDKEDVVIDVGAHFGYFTQLMSQMVGSTGKVLSIEASPRNFELLSLNTQDYTNVQTMNIALSDKNEEMTFYEFPTLYSEYNSLLKSQYANEDWMKDAKVNECLITAKTFDSLVTSLPKIKLVKIDVEGAELSVINGMATFLASGEPLQIVMEYLYGKSNTQNYLEAVALLIKAKFKLFKLNDEGKTERLELSELVQHFKTSNNDSDNLLFIRS